MDDYYRRSYGFAAVMKAYRELLERTRVEFVAAKPSRMRAFDLQTTAPASQSINGTPK